MSACVKVLLVDDEEDSKILLEEYLSDNDWQYRLWVVENEDDMRFELRDHVFDFVIIDYKLPDYNCKDAITLIRELGLDMPVFVMSNKVETKHVAEEVMQLGAQDFIPKFEMVRLSPAMHREQEQADKRKKLLAVENANEMATKLLFKMSSSLNWVLQHSVAEISFEILLEDFGKIIGAQRTYIYERATGCQQCGPDGVCYKMAHVWGDDNCEIDKFVARFETITENNYPNCVNTLESKKLYTINVDIGNEYELKSLKLLKSKTITCTPILNPDGTIYGFFGFDTKKKRECRPIEKSAIQAIATTIGIIMYKVREESAYNEQIAKSTERIEKYTETIDDTILILEKNLKVGND